MPPSQDPLLDEHWYTVEVIQGFDRWSIDLDYLLKGKGNVGMWEKFMKTLRLVKSDKLWILARRNDNDK